MMLTDLTIAAARDGLRARRFSAGELVEAHLHAVAALNARLNAFLTVTPDLALAQAEAADAVLARGDASPLTGIPLAIKDLFCTAGTRTTAGSKILQDFVPPYESTVTAHLLRDGAVFLGKTNLDEFAMGSSNMTSAFGPVESPVEAAGVRRGPGARRLLRRGRRRRRFRRASPWAPPAPIPAVPSGSRRRFAASPASSPATGGAAAGASWRLRVRWISRGRSRAPCGIAPFCWAAWRASTRRTAPASIVRCRITRRLAGAACAGCASASPANTGWMG